MEAYRGWEMGAGPSPAFLLSMIWALPEGSMTKALMRGGREFFGWGLLEHGVANLYDALNVNTQVSGSWKNKPPKFPHYPVPKAKPKTPTGEAKAVSVADLFSAFHKRG